MSQSQPLHGPALSEIPYLYGAIERPRLIETLRSKWQHQLVFVSAPAGYGKTSLVAEFARSVHAPVAWYTLRAVDRDHAALHDHVIQALSAIVPSISLELTGEFSPTEKAIRLGRFLQQQVTEHSLIVLDELHHIDGIATCQNWLNSLIDHLPNTCHLILASRTQPDISFIRLIAQEKIWGIGPTDLRFDPLELNRLEEYHHLSSYTANQSPLLAKLDGWPAGVRLALQPLSSEFVGSMLNSTLTAPEALFEQLARQMFNQLPIGLQSFLMSCSTLEYFNLHGCAEILGLGESVRWLDQAIQQNVFLYQIGKGFSFHPLFRDLLQGELRRSKPDSFAALHHKAARWFEGRRNFGSAFTHYATSEDFAKAQQLAESTAILMYGQNRFEMLLEWNQVLKLANKPTPQLSFTCSSIHLDRYEYEQALDELTSIINEPRAIVQRAFIIQQVGQYQQALDLLAQIPNSALEDQQLRSLALRVKGLAHFWLGDQEVAVAHLEECVALQREHGTVARLSHMLQDLQMMYSRMSRMEDAGTCLQEIVTLRRKLQGASGIALALHNLGDHYHQQSRYLAAIDTLEEGLDVLAEVRTRRVEGVLKWTLGNIMRDFGAFDLAQTYYQAAWSLCPPEPEPQLHVGILLHMAYLARWQGQLDDAEQLIEDALSLATQHQMKLETLLARAYRWILQSLTDLTEKPDVEPLLELTNQIRERHGFFPLLRIYAAAADALLAQGETDTAVQLIRSAVQIADQIVTAQPIAAEMLHSPRLRELVVSHLSLYSKLIDHDFHELQAFAQVEEGNQTHSSDAERVYSLKVFTLGQEAVERNGEPVSVASWRGAQSRQLFFRLLFEGAQTRKQIALELWPDSSENQARENFNTTLYQARHALGKDVIQLVDGRYLINPTIDLWCDAKEFEEAIATASLLPISDPYATQILENTVGLYRDDFLPMIDTGWATPIRERLRLLYLATLKRLGQAAHRARDFHQAIERWQQFLALDPLDESVNLMLVKCYALDLNQKHVAIKYYTAFKQQLDDELGIEPGEEMQRFVSQLMT